VDLLLHPADGDARHRPNRRCDGAGACGHLVISGCRTGSTASGGVAQVVLVKTVVVARRSCASSTGSTTSPLTRETLASALALPGVAL